MGEIKPKKMVNRSVAIALGILCIILAIGVIGAFAYYIPIVNDKNNTLTTLNSQITDKDNTISSLNSQISAKDSQISQLNSNIINLQSILDLQQSEVIVSQSTINQGASQQTVVVGRSFLYSGYLDITLTSTTTNAYVILQYWFGGNLYTLQKTVGTSGEAFFAILKTDSATVYVGNSNWLNGATHTITITYHY